MSKALSFIADNDYARFAVASILAVVIGGAYVAFTVGALVTEYPFMIGN